jgi:hypothetical protein
LEIAALNDWGVEDVDSPPQPTIPERNAARASPDIACFMDLNLCREGRMPRALLAPVRG